MGTVNRNISRFEFTAVYSHPEAKADIVLVHGLNGDPQKTWTAKNNVFWPTDLLPRSLKDPHTSKDEHANILVYGYNADVYAHGKSGASPSANFIHQHAQSLVASLTQYRKSKGTERLPIIWVVHSLGGIVTKRALLYSNDIRAHHQEDLRSVFVSTFAIIFLGTPHLGSDLATWGRMIQAMSDAVMPRKFFETESVLLKTLKKDNETLENINLHFLDIHQKFRIHMVHENHKTDLKGTKALVVEPASASPPLIGVTYYGIEATHSGMCKFDSENAPGYLNVSTAIREWVADAPQVIQVRWSLEEEESQNRAELEIHERAQQLYKPRAGLSSQTLYQPIGRFLPQAGRGRYYMMHHPPKRQSRFTIDVEEMDEDADDISDAEEESNNDNSLPPPSQKPPELLSLPSSSRPPPPAPLTLETSHPPSQDQSQGQLQSQLQLMAGSATSNEPPFVHPDSFRPNSFFIGRDDELRGLHEMLMDRYRRREGTSAVLIQCLPGGGKSHLARQYVFKHKDDYPGGVYWVRAKTRHDLESGFWRIARNEALRGLVDQRDVDELRDPKKMVSIVRTWLNKQSGWLMVLDGIQFDIPDVHEFIPFARNTSMIYTSTERSVAGDSRFDNPQVMELGLLTPQEAQELLLREMDKKQPWSPDDLANALQLVQLMQRLPLMIHVAAQHLKATREPLSKYLKSYKSRPRVDNLETYKKVREQLENRGANTALNLISILVFFDQHIPVEMVILGLSALDRATPIKTSDAPHWKTNLNNTLKVLIAFALVERTESDDISPTSSRSSKRSFDKNVEYLDLLRIHSVVQAFFIETLDKEKQVAFWLERATAIWCRSFDEAHKRIIEDPAIGLPDDYRRYSIHGQRLLLNLDRFEKKFPKLLSIARKEVESRLETIQGRIEELSHAIQTSIVTGKSEVAPTSIFGRSNSISESDSGTTPLTTPPANESQTSWDFFPNGEHGGNPLQSPSSYESMPSTPFEWQVPYPTRALMPAAPELDDDEQTVMASSAIWTPQPQPQPQPLGATTITTSDLANGSLPTSSSPAGQVPGDLLPDAYEDWHTVIPHHRVIKRQETRRYHDRGGAWRDKSVGDPRVGVTLDVAVGAVNTGRTTATSRSPSRTRGVTARSDAEMELNKLRKHSLPHVFQSPSPPDQAGSGGQAEASLKNAAGLAPTLSHDSAPALNVPATSSPTEMSSGLARVIASPRDWLKKLKENLAPSSSASAPASVPASQVQQSGDGAATQSQPPPPNNEELLVPPESIFRGSRTASSSPANHSSPFQPPTFAATSDITTLADLAQHEVPVVRRWDTAGYPAGSTDHFYQGFDSGPASQPAGDSGPWDPAPDPLSLSSPILPPRESLATQLNRPMARPLQGQPQQQQWIRPPPSGYTSQPMSRDPSHQSSSSSPRHSPIGDLSPLSPISVGSLSAGSRNNKGGGSPSSPLATSSTTNAQDIPYPTDINGRAFNHNGGGGNPRIVPLSLAPHSSNHRPASYTETEPSPRMDPAFPDVESSYRRWEQLHDQGHGHTHLRQEYVGQGASSSFPLSHYSQYHPPPSSSMGHGYIVSSPIPPPLPSPTLVPNVAPPPPPLLTSSSGSGTPGSAPISVPVHSSPLRFYLNLNRRGTRRRASGRSGSGSGKDTGRSQSLSPSTSTMRRPWPFSQHSSSQPSQHPHPHPHPLQQQDVNQQPELHHHHRHHESTPPIGSMSPVVGPAAASSIERFGSSAPTITTTASGHGHHTHAHTASEPMIRGGSSSGFSSGAGIKVADGYMVEFPTTPATTTGHNNPNNGTPRSTGSYSPTGTPPLGTAVGVSRGRRIISSTTGGSPLIVGGTTGGAGHGGGGRVRSGSSPGPLPPSFITTAAAGGRVPMPRGTTDSLDFIATATAATTTGGGAGGAGSGHGLGISGHSHSQPYE